MTRHIHRLRTVAHASKEAVWTSSIIPATDVGPRRMLAWMGVAVGLATIRVAVKLLPKAQPIRLFFEGLMAQPPFRGRDLPRNLGWNATPDDDDEPSARPIPAH